MSPVVARRRPGVLAGLGFGLLLLVVLAGAAGTAWALGWVKLPGTEAAVVEGPERQQGPPGTQPVPVSARAIPAYTRLTRDDILDAKTLQVRVAWLDPARLPPDVVLEVPKILGRVVGEAKSSGYVFRESDFLPEGTQPGLVAGIPAGKRAMRIELSKIAGFYGLREGDRFDVLATLAIDATSKDLARLPVGQGGARQLALEASLTNALKAATVKVIVQNGVMVTPMETRQVPYTVNSLTQGTLVRTRPVQEIVIAVDPGEVARLTEALAVEAELACVPRSGRPDDPQDSITPDLQPDPRLPMLGFGSGGGTGNSAEGMFFIERIDGDQREMRVIPHLGGPGGH
jgi:Flp pilus assembly protein CpaB